MEERTFDELAQSAIKALEQEAHTPNIIWLLGAAHTMDNTSKAMKEVDQGHKGWWKTAICANCIRVGTNVRFVGPRDGPAKMSRSAKHGIDPRAKIKDACIPAVLNQFGWVQQREPPLLDGCLEQNCHSKL